MRRVEPLRVTTARFGADSYVVGLAGELDLGTSDQFARELDALRERGARHLIVDLLGITFLGSAGLALLTRAAKQTRAVGGDCVVVSDDPRTLRVFEITGLERTFRIERSLMEAVGQLAAGARVVA